MEIETGLRLGIILRQSAAQKIALKMPGKHDTDFCQFEHDDIENYLHEHFSNLCITEFHTSFTAGTILNDTKK